ncbi:hypothetical protein KVR01_010592 [Diaporthe batatas]|uniref:uncharacterized protein n=1 Tax=Diaporthe batatas TaxID=748121 RepID=UPI001D059BB8|nr:uncharacterized protein KVR01_010592 [Diaporthe batatas]KAG8159955.1 hypothetical protein KVR01_010592 [Diaporthe batatas]
MADDGITDEAGTGQKQLVISSGNTAFEFLKLPPEIRNKIYWNALVKNHDCHFFFQPPLTRVNKQIRSESLPVLYGNNKFSVCLFEGFLSDFPWKFPELRKRWDTPPQIPAVSTVSSFAYITRLDIRHEFWDGEYPGSCVFIDVCMRDKEPNCPGLQNHRKRDMKPVCAGLRNRLMIRRPESGWESRVEIVSICIHLLSHSASLLEWHGDNPLFQPVLDYMVEVMESLFFIAEKCPAAANWVWLVVEASDIDYPYTEYDDVFDEDLWIPMWFYLEGHYDSEGYIPGESDFEEGDD